MLLCFFGYKKTFRSLSYLIAGLLVVSSCKSGITGQLEENKPPDTHTITDTIIRTGPDRLNSEVHVRWWGDDPDGFVAGFEFTFDPLLNSVTVWNYTERYDTVFVLSPPPGEDTVDFILSVRAVDNNGLKDPTPARLIYPVKNSPPAITFIPGNQNPIKTFPVVKFYIEGSDPDGFENLSRYEMAWNDSTAQPYILDPSTTSITFSATDPTSDFPECEVILNNNIDPESELIEGMRLNDTNKLYIRAIDNSDASSDFEISYTIFIKKINSDLLFVNAYSQQSQAIEDFYTQNTFNRGITVFDTVQIFEQKNAEFSQLAPDNITQARIFSQFKTIIWFGNNAENSLSLAQKTTNEFFNLGGKLFMSIYISSGFDEQSFRKKLSTSRTER